MRHTRIYALDRAESEWRRNVPFYRDEASSPFQARFIKEKRSVYGLGESHRHVLDLGAGVGEFASLLMDEGRAVIAVDFVLEMALAAREKRPRLRYVVASADRLPFKGDRFDAIIADGVLHHIKVQGILEEGISEAARLLRRGGRLCAFDRNGSLLSRALLVLFVALNRAVRLWKPDYASSATGHECSLGREDRRMIARHGFKVVARRNVSSFPFFLAVVLSNAAGYFGGSRRGAAWRRRMFPAAAWLEDRIRARSPTVEECVAFDLETG
jgi:SAM-dependent methyltransferase